MSSYTDLRQIVVDSGLWDRGREASHAFVLSPSLYVITKDQKNQLEQLGRAITDSLAGIGRLAAIAADPQLARTPGWQTVNRSLKVGVPQNYHGLRQSYPTQVPAICKVDLMEGKDGRYYIAEIDGHNKHGMGYATLAARLRQAIAPSTTTFPGVAQLIAPWIAQQSTKGQMILLTADQERFYLPEVAILGDELARHNIELTILPENVAYTQYNNQVAGEIYADLPFLYHSPGLHQKLAEAYQEGQVRFLIPPKPFFGSKAVLALLRNDENDPELEAILRSQITSATLETIRPFIPETRFVTKEKQSATKWAALFQEQRYVLKRTIAYGMKGTTFADSRDFSSVLARACDSHYQYVAQQEVDQQSRTFAAYNHSGAITEGQWYTRVTAHFHYQQVADITVTARQSKDVHGAKDCLQLGTIIE